MGEGRFLLRMIAGIRYPSADRALILAAGVREP